LFITFEGIDGCGKSTQIARFEARLRKAGIFPVVTREPGGTRTGEAIREIVLHLDGVNVTPLTQLFLYEADRAQHIEEIVKPSLELGKWVVCDRFFDATTVYQGIVQGQGEVLTEQLNHLSASGLNPDITFLLDCPAEIAMERIKKRGSETKKRDMFDKKDIDFHRKIRYGYLSIADKCKDRFKIIDASLAIDEISREIGKAISPYLIDKKR
jgi:dTMP kinase